MRDELREPFHFHGAAHGVAGAASTEIRDQRDPDGIGDMTIMGQYRLPEFPETKIQAAILFGAKTPTGDTTVDSGTATITNSGGFTRTFESELLETENQPGSGSWDGIFGMAFSRSFGSLSVDSSFLYTLVTEGSQDTDLGDVVNYNLALSYSLGEWIVPVLSKPWDLVLELNGEWRDELEVIEDGV